MRQILHRRAASLWVLGCYTLVGAIASAQEPPHMVTASGRGKVKAAPTSVELTGRISAAEELAGDALTKFL